MRPQANNVLQLRTYDWQVRIFKSLPHNIALKYQSQYSALPYRTHQKEISFGLLSHVVTGRLSYEKFVLNKLTLP